MFSDLKINQQSPIFKLKGVEAGREDIWNSANLRGKWILLFFYPADFSNFSSSDVKTFQGKISDFKARNCLVLGCSTDSHFSHKAWAESLGGIDYPLLADVHHTVSIDYNVFVETEAVSQPGTFIIDPNGVLKFYQITDNNISRNVDELIRILEVLQSEKT